MKAKRYLTLIIGTLSLLPLLAHSAPAVTKSNYLACRTQKVLNQAIVYARQNNNAQLQQLIETRDCIAMKAGISVVTLQGTETDGKVAFMFNGSKFWTLTAALQMSPDTNPKMAPQSAPQ